MLESGDCDWLKGVGSEMFAVLLSPGSAACGLGETNEGCGLFVMSPTAGDDIAGGEGDGDGGVESCGVGLVGEVEGRGDGLPASFGDGDGDGLGDGDGVGDGDVGLGEGDGDGIGEGDEFGVGDGLIGEHAPTTLLQVPWMHVMLTSPTRPGVQLVRQTPPPAVPLHDAGQPMLPIGACGITPWHTASSDNTVQIERSGGTGQRSLHAFCACHKQKHHTMLDMPQAAEQCFSPSGNAGIRQGECKETDGKSGAEYGRTGTTLAPCSLLPSGIMPTSSRLHVRASFSEPALSQR